MSVNTPTSSEGYLVIAMGQRIYLDMARHAAMSIKLLDTDRPICLVHDSAIHLDDSDNLLFSNTCLLEQEPDLVGCINKIRLFDCTPYQRTMYVDADCLLVKKGLDAYWKLFRGMYFNMTGEKATSGRWYHINIRHACETLGVPYIVRMNSGVFYFEKTQDAQEFFSYMMSIHKNNRKYLGTLHRDREGQYADEPFFGVAMGHFGIDPIQIIPGVGSLMVTTYMSRNLFVDVDLGVCYLEKAARFLGYPHRLTATKWVRHSPLFVHFIDLAPRKTYNELVSYYSRRFKAIPGSVAGG